MLSTAIALNRFGLGARPSDPQPADPRTWLLTQLRSFEPRPQAFASLPTRREIAMDIADFIVDERMGGGRKGRRAAMVDAGMPMNGADDEAPANPARRAMRQDMRGRYVEMNGARVNAALTTPAPFAERLAHFWANHFAVSTERLPVLGLAGLLEFEAIRPNLMRRFSDMLLAVERHPAMLLYLDQAQSVGPNSPLALRAAERSSKQRGLNENLAREILELHTLGVNGGYTQVDVTEFARALTGWTVAGISRGPAARVMGGNPGEFYFANVIHEPGDRQIVGRRYAQSGEEQGRAVLMSLAAHPSTSRHIATKLARHFAGDDPPPAMVDRLSQAFLRSGGDLPTLYRALVDSPEAWVDRPVKFKTPWEWTVSAFRATGSTGVDPQIATGLLNQLGQPTWKPGSPAGWDDTAPSWAAPEALLLRADAAERLAARSDAGTDARALAEKLLPGALGAATRSAIARAESRQQGLALLLVSPEFLRR